jgi:phage gp46-like protein
MVNVADILIIDTGTQGGSGGDMQLVGNDLAVVHGWENMIYLALFGGNPGYVTPVERVAGQQAFDYWGNVFYNDLGVQFNSLTEHILTNVSLTSGNKLKIDQAIAEDLAFMSAFAEITITTVIESPTRLRIDVLVQEPDNLQAQQYVFIWDGTKADAANYAPNSTNNGYVFGLQYTLQTSL